MSRAHSIRRKLSLSYILYILIFVLFIGILSNFIIQKQFSTYAEKKQQIQLTHIANEISFQYMMSWNLDNIDYIGKHEIDNGYIISVYDINGDVVWDAREHNNHQCTMVIENIKIRMIENNPNWNGEYVETMFPLYSNDNKIGTVQIGYFSPYFYTSDDFAFLTALNSLYLFTSIIFIFIAIILGTIMSKRLSKPIQDIVIATSNIAKGNYKKMLKEESNIIEINQLTCSINTLAKSLENQELLRKQLTSDVTHELRTPLTTLQTHIEAMIDGVLEKDNKQLISVHEEIIRLTTIVKDLDKLMHYDKEIVILNKENLNISEIIRNIIKIFEVPFINKNVSLITNLEPAFTTVDKDKIYQVFYNLISNSLKYTPSGKDVSIKVKNELNEVLVSIEDTGIGISDKDLPHIFERFYRADQSRNRKTGGAGIGLAIVKSIVQVHKGRIIAQSKINEGTKFIVHLPKERSNSL